MKSKLIPKLIFWSISLPLWLMSALFAIMAYNGFLEAPAGLAHEMQIKTTLEHRAAFVDGYIKTNGFLPTESAFEHASEEMKADLQYPSESKMFYLWSARPKKEKEEGFNFPPWPKDGTFYIISYWRGDWAEYYDSHSRKTTLDSANLRGERMIVFPIIFISFAFALPPFLFLWFKKKVAQKSYSTINSANSAW